jgi:hypothetical protein
MSSTISTLLRVASVLLESAARKGSPRSFDVLLKTLARLLREHSATRKQADKLTAKGVSGMYPNERRALLKLWRSVELLAIAQEGKISGLGNDTFGKRVRDDAESFFDEMSKSVEADATHSLLSAFERIVSTLIKQTYDAIRKDRPRPTSVAKRALPPKDFHTFRKMLARTIKPYDVMLSNTIGDLDYENRIVGVLNSSVWKQYSAATDGMKSRDPKRPAAFLKCMVDNLPGALERVVDLSLKDYSPRGAPSQHLRHSQISMVVQDFVKGFAGRLPK